MKNSTEPMVEIEWSDTDPGYIKSGADMITAIPQDEWDSWDKSDENPTVFDSDLLEINKGEGNGG